jgi:hypothetical protein
MKPMKAMKKMKMKNKKHKWKCPTCSEEIFCTKQPLCKACSHIERKNVEMERVDD